MPITSQIGSSSLIKPGVIDSAATRPASPYAGQTIFETDTNRTLVWNGTAWLVTSGPYTAYAATPAGLGNGTANFRYSQNYKTVHFHGTIVHGSTTTFVQDITLPLTASSSYGFLDDMGTCVARDVSANLYYAMDYIFINSTTVRILWSAGISSGATNGLFDISSTAPFTWATGDFISFNLMYEAA